MSAPTAAVRSNAGGERCTSQTPPQLWGSAAPAAGHTEGPTLNYNVKIYVLWLDIEGRSCVMKLTDLHPHTDSEREGFGL